MLVAFLALEAKTQEPGVDDATDRNPLGPFVNPRQAKARGHSRQGYTRDGDLTIERWQKGWREGGMGGGTRYLDCLHLDESQKAGGLATYARAGERRRERGSTSQLGEAETRGIKTK